MTYDNSTKSAAAAELKRRRNLLCQHIGAEVQIKRSCLSKGDRRSGLPFVGTLVDVKRTRALVRFGEPVDDPDWITPKGIWGVSGEWSVPIAHVLLPGSVEPLPGQMEFIDVATDMEVAR